MKKLFIPLMLIALCFINVNAQMAYVELEEEPRYSAAAILSVDMISYDFGEIKKGTPVNHEFAVKNTGEAPLVINSVKASCGCTASDYTKDAILPSEEGFIKATYNAAKAGAFNKSLSVMSNGGEVTLYIKGTVVE